VIFKCPTVGAFFPTVHPVDQLNRSGRRQAKLVRRAGCLYILCLSNSFITRS
jgi:hypothetical protein